MPETSAVCISCGCETTNVEHVCSDCTAGARARLAVRALTDEDLLTTQGPGRPPRNGARAPISDRAIAGRIGVGKDTVRRARASEAAARGLVAAAPKPPAHVGRGDSSPEWQTPASIVEAARGVLGGIDLDPASTAEANETVGAARFFTAADDGLAQPWAGRVWMNPPYSTGLVDRFVAKLLDEPIDAAVTLTNNATETRWCQALLAAADVVCLPAGRIRFAGAAGAGPLQGQLICGVGVDPDRFAARFGDLGRILAPR